MGKILKRVKESATAAWKKEPVRIVTTAVGIVVAVSAKLGFVVPEADVAQAVAILITILVGGVVARSQVTPTK